MRVYCPVPAGQWSVGDTLRGNAVADVAPSTASDAARTAVAEQFGAKIAPGVEDVLFDVPGTTAPERVLREWIVEHVRRNIDADLPSRFTAVRGHDTPVTGTATTATDIELLVVRAADPAGPFYPGHLVADTPAELLAGAEEYWTGMPAGDGPREYLLTEPAPIIAIEPGNVQHDSE